MSTSTLPTTCSRCGLEITPSAKIPGRWADGWNRTIGDINTAQEHQHAPAVIHMSTSYRRGDTVQHRDTGERGTVVVDTDRIGLTIVSWPDGSTSTDVAVDLVPMAVPVPRIRRGDVVRHVRDDVRGIVEDVHEDGRIVTVRWWNAGVIAGGAYAVDLEIVRPRRYSPAIAAAIEGWDGGDPWGSAMDMAWAVAEVARAGVVGTEVAATLEVSWGAMSPMSIDEMADVEEDPDNRGDVSFTTAMLAAAYRDGRVTDDDLTFAARVLDRYLDILRAAGHDY